MKLQTEVSVTPLEKGFSYKDKLLFIGSCFAQEIGGRCADRYMQAQVNPFGVIFNPASVSTSIELLSGVRSFSSDDIIETPSGYCSFFHHSSFARAVNSDFLNDAQTALDASIKHFKDCGWVFITLGTSVVYKDRQSGQIVSNCHKLPQSRFERRMLGYHETMAYLEHIMSLCEGRQVIFTVSPVRHVADGLHQNQLSKSKLLLAVDETVSHYSNAHYFPAYEILLDELRDYRFFADDLAHPSQLAADIVFDRFMDFALQPSERTRLARATSILQKFRHRPINPDSPAAKEFLASREQELSSFLSEIII